MDDQTPKPHVNRRTALARALRAAYWLLAAGLIALNGWWFWVDRPLEDLKPVDSWITRGQLL